MTHRKQLVTTLLLLSAITLNANQEITPYYSIRSQGVNAARHLAGWGNFIHIFDVDTLYGSFSFTPEYTRTFASDKITCCLFGKECDQKDCPTITITGSRVPDRQATDWLADYFYLPTDFKSTLSFSPVIDNILVDLNFYLGLENWYPGLYFYVYTPLVHTRWDLKVKENVIKKGVNAHPAGYFTPAELERKYLLNDAKEFFSGRIPQPVAQTITDVHFSTNDIEITTCFQRLKKARMHCKRRNRTRFADLRTGIGFDFAQGERYHIGVSFQLAAPTGNHPEGRFLFEPIVGNGHHWELGGAIDAHVMFYRSENEEEQCSLYGQVNITHLFGARQHRTFDLINNGQFSRYMLAEKLNTPIKNNLKGNGTTPAAQFKTEFQPIANLNTIPVVVSAGAQVDAVLMLNCTTGGFSWDVGYNFWARSCEKITLRAITELEANKTWALKGDAHIFGFLAKDNNPLEKNFPVALSATQHCATINAGTNFPLGTTTFTEGRKNPNVDGTQPATAGANNQRLLFAPNQVNNDDNQIKTSIDPVFPQVTDLNICDARTRGMSSKFFTHFGYTWWNHEQYVPYFGIGGEIEFAHGTNNECQDNCKKAICIRCAVHQWGIWFKGGISFE